MIRITAPAKDTGLVGLLSGQYRQYRSHGLGRCQLTLATEGQSHRTCADGRVKALNKASLRSSLQVRSHLTEVAIQGLAQHRQVLFCNMCISMFHCAIGIQECAAQIGNCLSLPGHNHPFFFCHNSNTVSFQVFLFSSSNKGICIFGFNHNSHTLLRLRNGNFSTIQAIVLLTDGIQVDFQAGSQLTDCDRNTACTEVITTLNEPSHFGIAEQALDLSFFGGIALLNLGCHSGQRLHIVALGRTGGATDAVTTGAATKQNNYITCSRALTANIIGRCSSYNSATLQTLGNIAIMIHFSNMAGSKTDLVAVGRITCSSSLADLSLGQLAGQGFGDTFSGVTCTGNTHCLVDIGTTGQGVTDTTANTSGGTAKRFNFSRMVMRFIFEHQ